MRRGPARRRGRPDRRVRRSRTAGPGSRPDAETRHPGALLRRERRHAARRARAVRIEDQQGVGPRAEEALLRRLRLRAPGRRERGSDRPLARPAAQLRAAGGLRLPEPRHGARRPHPGRPRIPALRDPLALERAALPPPRPVRGTARGCRRTCSGCARTTSSSRRSRRSSRAPRRCPAGPSRSRWTIRSCAQTIEDCLTEAMDVDGFLEVLRGLKDGSIERRAVDTVEPSAFARGILSSQPYTFLDDAPLEERRTQAVFSRRVLDTRSADEIGILDPEAIARVREEAWPRAVERRGSARGAPLDGVRHRRGGPPAGRRGWTSSPPAGRVALEGGRWFAAEAPRDPKAVLRGRMEALGPIVADERRRSRCSASSRPKAPCCARASRGARPGATGGFSRASTATRSTACARRSSPSPPRSSCASSRAGSMRTPSIASTARAASRRSSRSSPDSRSPPPRGKAASSRRACAGTSANGSTSSRSRERSSGAGSGARRRGRRGARRSASSNGATSTSGPRSRRRFPRESPPEERSRSRRRSSGKARCSSRSSRARRSCRRRSSRKA